MCRNTLVFLKMCVHRARDRCKLFSHLQVFREHPLMAVYSSEDPLLDDQYGPIYNQPNTALLSLVLMMGTFFVAFFLRKFRNSRFLGGKVNLCL